jgi:hypothetical protein
MLFLNAGLLLGMAAVSIPIIIHLFSRRTATYLDWGAIRFLLDSIVTRRRRIMLEEALLMITRCLVLTSIALAMARPFVPPGSRIPWVVIMPMILLAVVCLCAAVAVWSIPRWRKWLLVSFLALLILACLAVTLEKFLNLRRFGGGKQQDVAIVIDGSMSMMLEVGGKSNFDRAVDQARELVKSARTGIDFSIIVGGSSPALITPLPVGDRTELTELIDGLKPVGGSMDAVATLLESVEALARGFHPSKQIIIISDGQDTGWHTESPAQWRLVYDAVKRLPVAPQIILRTLDLPKEFRNAAVADVTFSRDVVGTDREVTVNVRVENTGTEAVTPNEVKLTVGGEELIDNTLGQIVPGASETLRFPYHFKKEGSHVMTARVVVNDELPQDNEFPRVRHVIGRLPVLLVDGNPAGRFMERAAAFTALALAPAPRTANGEDAVQPVPQPAGGTPDFLVRPELVDAPGLAEVESFDDYAVIVLADVPRVPERTADRLASYVSAGGGLLVAPGERAIPEFYNEWSQGAGRRLMPAQLEQRAIIENPDDEATPSLSTFSHRCLRTVADAGQSDIGSLRLSAYWQLKEDDYDENVGVGGRFNNGDAFLVERKLGRGFVLVSACSLDTRGSNLATRHAFVPLLHEMVSYLANPAGVQLKCEPGAGLALRLTDKAPASGTRASRTAPDVRTPATAVAPDGGKRAAQLITGAEGIRATVGGHAVPGLYRIELPEDGRTPLTDVLAADGTIPFTVEGSVNESRLSVLDDEDITFVTKYADFVQTESLDQVKHILSGKAFGEELWKFLAVGALFFLLAENALTRWIAMRRKSGQNLLIEFEDKNAPSPGFIEQAKRIKEKLARARVAGSPSASSG